MRFVLVSMIALLGLLLAESSSVRASGGALPRAIELHEEVEVQSAQITLGDLSVAELEGRTAELVVLRAPAPGYTAEFSRTKLRRLMASAGLRPLPRLTGADHVRVRRAGRILEPPELGESLLPLLGRLPLPPGAVDQTFRLRGSARIAVPPGPVRFELRSLPLPVGVSPIRFAVLDAGHHETIGSMTVHRSLRTVAWRTARAVDARSSIGPEDARPDSVWVSDRRQWDRIFRQRQELTGRSATRSLPGGHLLLRPDLRSTPVVRRGSSVAWVVERNGLRITLRARARGEGVVGDWIYVESPLDRRMKRVCILGPGEVGDPAMSTELEDRETRPSRKTGGGTP